MSDSKHTVIILRGVSGAGKSRWANDERQILEEDEGLRVSVISASDYMVDRQGCFQFDRSKLRSVHKRCRKRFLRELVGGEVDVVIVDNNNTSVAEIAYYAELADTLDWAVEVYTLDVDPDVAQARSVHGVDLKTVNHQHSSMLRNTRLIPKRWNHRVIQ